MRETSRTRQDAANGYKRHGVFAITGPIETRKERERERERETPLLPGNVRVHCTVRLRTCAYPSELLFYLIPAAAATLSRRLARATFYSLLPSRSDCTPLPPFPCISIACTRILRLFHFISFTSSFNSQLFFFPFVFFLYVYFSLHLIFFSFLFLVLFFFFSEHVSFLFTQILEKKSRYIGILIDSTTTDFIKVLI